MKGGARSRSGPAPDPNALRRERDAHAWLNLPPEGYQGPIPDWPLIRPTRRELDKWAIEWRRPQAVIWLNNGQMDEVALYVRCFVGAERPTATTSSRILVRQFQEALGLSLTGLARNHWRIAESAQPVRPQQARSRPSVRERFKLISGEGA